MNEASRWRFEIGQAVALIIARNPKVEAIVLAGSVSRGNADSYSDIEINVFWAKPPTEEDLTQPIEPCGGINWEVDPYDPDEDNWMNEWGLGGVKMDMRNRTVAGFERILNEVTQNADTTDFKQIAVSAIQYGIALHNPALLERWHAQMTPYPPALGIAMVREHLHRDSWCWWVEMLATRGDLPLVYAALSELAHQILAILMGVNEIYHPGFKWIERLITEMSIKPENLLSRIQQSFQAEPLQAVAIFRDLMQETYDLVDTHLPEVDTSEARTKFLHQRPQIASMPHGIIPFE